MLLVTGANGNLGRSIIGNLRKLVGPKEFAVATRNVETPFVRGLAQEGVEVRRADFDDASSLPGAFAGIEKALIISTYSDNSVRLQQNLRALSAARAAGVRHFIYTSFAGASPRSLSEHSRLVHYPTEQAIRESGLQYTILRHALYAEVTVQDVDETLASGVLYRCGGEAACAYIAREDLGLSAATVLARAGHENRIYTETMASPLTGREIARALSDTFGRPVEYRALDPEEWAQYMMRTWHLPEPLARSAMGTMRAIAAGEFDLASNDYQSITGRAPRSYGEFLRGVKAAREQTAG